MASSCLADRVGDSRQVKAPWRHPDRAPSARHVGIGMLAGADWVTLIAESVLQAATLAWEVPGALVAAVAVVAPMVDMQSREPLLAFCHECAIATAHAAATTRHSTLRSLPLVHVSHPSPVFAPESPEGRPTATI